MLFTESSLKRHDIESNRWEKGIRHDKRSVEIMCALADIDFNLFEDSFRWKIGGDGDNGETLMYQLDIYFEMLDKEVVK
jgi:hypothetical protein